MDHVGFGGGIGHHQIGRQRRQRRVRAPQLRVGLVGERARTRRAHAVHVHLAKLAQLRDELGHVHPRAAVNLRRILPSHHRHPHTRHGSSATMRAVKRPAEEADKSESVSATMRAVKRPVEEADK